MKKIKRFIAIVIAFTMMLSIIAMPTVVLADPLLDTPVVTLANAEISWLGVVDADHYVITAHNSAGVLVRTATVPSTVTSFNLQTDFNLPTPRQAVIRVQAISDDPLVLDSELSVPTAPFSPTGNVVSSPNTVVNRSAPSPDGLDALRIDAGGNFIIIDARLTTDFTTAHVPNAIHFSNFPAAPYVAAGTVPDAFSQRALAEIRVLPAYSGPNTLIFTYCAGGNRSIPSANWLASQGFTNVIDGGTPANLATAFGATIQPLAQPVVSATGTNLSWTAVPNATGYMVFAFEADLTIGTPPRAVTEFVPSSNTALAQLHAADYTTITGTTFDVSTLNLVEGDDYVIRVQAIAGTGNSNSLLSAFVAVTPPITSLAVPTVTLNNAIVSWPAVTGADRYVVRAYTNNNGSPDVMVRETETTSTTFNLQTDSNLPTPRQALIRVQAVSDDTNITNSAFSVPTAPFSPTGNVGSDAANINRSAPSPAAIEALVADAGGNYIIIDSRMTTNFIAGHVPNALHFASIPGAAPYANQNDTVGAVPTGFSQRALAEISALSAYSGFDTLIFTYCVGGNRSVSSANWFALQGFTNVFDGGTPANLAQAFGATVVPLAQPTVTATEDTLSWDANPLASEFIVFAFDLDLLINSRPVAEFDPSNNTALAQSYAVDYATTTGNTFDVSGLNLPAGGDFVFRVQAIAGAGNSNSLLSEVVALVPDTGATTLATPVVTQDNAVITWNAVTNADRYIVVAYTNDGGSLGVRVREAELTGTVFNLQTGFNLPTPRQALIRVQAVSDDANVTDSAFSAPTAPFSPVGNVGSSPNDIVNRSAPSPDGIQALVAQAGGNYVIIDSRMTANFTAGHVPNALHFASVPGAAPYANQNDTVGAVPAGFSQRALAEIRVLAAYGGYDTLIFTYCVGGNRSVSTANWFALQGFINVFDGGTPANLATAFGATVVPLEQPVVTQTGDTLSWDANPLAAEFMVFAFDLDLLIDSRPVAEFNPSNNTALAQLYAVDYTTTTGNTFDVSGMNLPAGGDFVFRVQAIAGAGNSNSLLSALPAPATGEYFTVTFDLAGGNIAGDTANVVRENIASGANATPPANPTRSGFNFAGWSPAGGYNNVTADTTITAQWTAESAEYFTVTFDLAGGNIAGNTANVVRENIASGANATPPANPTRSGFNFAGWSPAGGYNNVTADTTITAQWTSVQQGGGGGGQQGQQQEPTAQQPSISSQPQGGTVAQGGAFTLSVATHVTDGGVLTFQWYSNTQNRNWGGTRITGATGSTFTPPTNVAGTNYFYVVITNTADGRVSARASNAVAVTVTAHATAQPPISDNDALPPNEEEDAFPPTPPIIPDPVPVFTDVSPHAWYYNAVRVVLAEGLFQGTAPQTFSPHGNMTRAMFVQVLANLEGVNLAAYSTRTGTFGDTDSTAWYFAAVEWAAGQGLASGVGEGNFAPNAHITREEMAVLLHRYIVSRGILLPQNETTHFTDSTEISPWAVEGIAAAQQAGLITGRPEGNFAPRDTATRAEVATIFARLLAYSQG
ncbi:MAG: S-layer homology domain-containing protein [Defluviitaleaceae bacterium]|nr:S-layer homology domain-containing protein [Defluviitaleaceae bacterium]